MIGQILLLVCVTLFLPFAPGWAQTDTQQKVTVSGTVVNSVTNEPVGGALVDMSGSGKNHVLAGADGHFQVEGAAGTYVTISARHPGFDQNQRSQRIKIDSNLDAITVKLTPLSRIAGRVLDSEGEPVEGILVTCIAQQIVNGRKQWQPHGGATTDETGNYLIEDLNSGAYILGTQEKQLYLTQPKSEAARYLYPPTFYPDSPSRDLAQRIDLAPGDEMRADMTLHSVRGIRITLFTVPPFANVIASIGQGEDQFGSNQALAGKAGELTFAAVPPGTWKIMARGPFSQRHDQSNQDPLYGELHVEAGSTDIDNLKLPMNRLPDIQVNVSGVENSKTYLQLYSKDGVVNGSSRELGGGLKVSGVTPGDYRVVSFGSGENCITSMISGSQDLLQDDLIVSAGGTVPPIQIVETSNCAQLTINTNIKEAAWVLITSNEKGFEPRMTPGASSGYISKGLNTGDYRVYAFDDANDLEYSNPEALRDFKSQTIHLDAGQKVTVQLEVNQRLAR